MLVPKRSDLEVLARLVEAGKLRPVVGEVFPLDAIREAHVRMQSGHARGKDRGAAVIAREEYPGGRTFEVVTGDLLSEPVDAIVNAANGHLAHGGGVAAAIARAAGPALEEEGDRLVTRQRDDPGRRGGGDDRGATAVQGRHPRGGAAPGPGP